MWRGKPTRSQAHKLSRTPRLYLAFLAPGMARRRYGLHHKAPCIFYTIAWCTRDACSDAAGASPTGPALTPSLPMSPPSSSPLAPAALRRKGKGDDVTEDDMEGFIAAHNSGWLLCVGRGLRNCAHIATMHTTVGGLCCWGVGLRNCAHIAMHTTVGGLCVCEEDCVPAHMQQLRTRVGGLYVSRGWGGRVVDAFVTMATLRMPSQCSPNIHMHAAVVMLMKPHASCAMSAVWKPGTVVPPQARSFQRQTMSSVVVLNAGARVIGDAWPLALPSPRHEQGHVAL